MQSSWTHNLRTHRGWRIVVVLLLAACSDEPADAGDATGTGGAAASSATGSGGVGSGGSGTSGSGGILGASGAGGAPSTSGTSGAGGASGQSGMGGGGAGGSVDAGNVVADSGVVRDAGDSDKDASTAPLKKFVGNITTSGQVRDDFEMYWDQITPENEGKWGSVEGTRDQMNWTGVDRVHDYAKAHGLIFKQHTFVWGSQQPGWLNGLSAAEQKQEVEEWIRLFCERYPDVALIDVVNEPPPHTTPVYMQALGGAGQSGYDWIVQAFAWARQYCPHAILILNDYNTIEYPNDNDNFLTIVRALQAANAEIDAIGAQAHAAHSRPDSEVKGYLGKLAATGLPIYITEYDIDEANDATQQQIMERQITMFWNDEAIRGITLWGYVRGATWQQNSGLMASGGQMRPAMTWLMDFLDR